MKTKTIGESTNKPTDCEELCKQYVTLISDYKLPFDWELDYESTADGYDIYIVKEKNDPISICDNIYYYDHSALERIEELIAEAIQDGNNIDIMDSADMLEQVDWDSIAESVEGSGQNENFNKALNVIMGDDD